MSSPYPARLHVVRLGSVPGQPWTLARDEDDYRSAAQLRARAAQIRSGTSIAGLPSDAPLCWQISHLRTVCDSSGGGTESVKDVAAAVYEIMAAVRADAAVAQRYTVVHLENVRVGGALLRDMEATFIALPNLAELRLDRATVDGQPIGWQHLQALAHANPGLKIMCPN